MNFAILIGSCDKYHYLWDHFNYLFHKYWDGKIDVKKYIITQEADARLNGIENIKVGDPSYTLGLKRALDLMNVDNILWLQDDYFFRRKIDYKEFERYFNLFIEWQADRFGIHEDSELYSKQNVVENINKLSQNSLYTISLQASLWNVNFLYKLLDKDESPWEFEVDGSSRLNFSNRHRIFYATQDDPWYLEACRKGELTNDFYNICKEEGINAGIT
tara:strand:- start:1052 stop:1702 length:651 start_codon:yes stop_codon:yes gene_type:complete